MALKIAHYLNSYSEFSLQETKPKSNSNWCDHDHKWQKTPVSVKLLTQGDWKVKLSEFA